MSHRVLVLGLVVGGLLAPRPAWGASPLIDCESSEPLASAEAGSGKQTLDGAETDSDGETRTA